MTQIGPESIFPAKQMEITKTAELLTRMGTPQARKTPFEVLTLAVEATEFAMKVKDTAERHDLLKKIKQRVTMRSAFAKERGLAGWMVDRLNSEIYPEISHGEFFRAHSEAPGARK